jgi:hypothetical protein
MQKLTKREEELVLLAFNFAMLTYGAHLTEDHGSNRRDAATKIHGDMIRAVSFLGREKSIENIAETIAMVRAEIKAAHNKK